MSEDRPITRAARVAGAGGLCLAIVLRVSGAGAAAVGGDPPVGTSTIRLQPGDVSYLGAFRLPGGEERPETFAYGGNAMTFRPGGDPAGMADGFAGSLFITGHDRMPYGELPNGSQIAEITIPAPVVSRSVDGLPAADFVQGFSDAAKGLFSGLDEIPRVGLQYHDDPATGPRLHVAWGQHLQGSDDLSHAMLSTTLSDPDPQGPWGIAGASPYSTTGYLFEIPEAWADAHTWGRRLATGRFRDGGWSGMGPALLAYQPWDGAGMVAAPGTRLEATTLLLYESSEQSQSVTRGVMADYQHADEWEGGAWVTTTSGKEAVLFAGTKATGTRTWYGWPHPDGTDLPCVETALADQFTVCRDAHGRACPASDLGGCTGHGDSRGWWSSRFAARLIFYDTGDLAEVAAGRLSPSAPQPYAWMDIDRYLFLTGDDVEPGMLGRGPQRRGRIGAVAFDRETGRLYILEPFADMAKPVVHVFAVSRVRPPPDPAQNSGPAEVQNSYSVSNLSPDRAAVETMSTSLDFHTNQTDSSRR